MNRPALLVLPFLLAGFLLTACDTPRPPCSSETITTEPCMLPSPPTPSLSDSAASPYAAGQLRYIITLTGLDADASRFEPTFLRGDKGTALYESLRAHNAPDRPELRDALTTPPPAGETGIAFVLNGCDEKSAVLLITPQVISAELRGGANTACESAVRFLATFTIEDEKLPPNVTLGR